MALILPGSYHKIAEVERNRISWIEPEQAERQDIRPLRIGILNIMPLGKQYEFNLLHPLGLSVLQIEPIWIRLNSHAYKSWDQNHLDQLYVSWDEALSQGPLDGLIITGAPVEHLPFEQVTYWEELRQIMDWTQTHVHSTFGVCWGGMAMIYHLHGINKRMLDAKAFGCFRHDNLVPASPYLRGFSDNFVIPVSRWTEIQQKEVDANADLKTLLGSSEVGPCLIKDAKHRALYIFNHFEYDSDTLKQEYDRDVSDGTPINVPQNYYPDDDPSQPPLNRWRSHAHLLYGNWVNQIYQTTPYDLNEIGA